MNPTSHDFIADLPIYDYRAAITAAVDANQVTIITAETGAGKSTQVPQYLADHGYTKVIVTQPRILAARNLSRRVREEWALRTSSDSQPIIGYRTAHERDDNPETVVLYCTDGLQLVREITGAGTSSRQILILDEVHEWNENMEVLVAWAKKRCLAEPDFKVVIMSATIETGSLADYFGTTAVINVPGRSYEVKWRRGSDVVSEIISQLTSQTSNMLVFLPGKSEIQTVASAISTRALAAGVPIIPLHSQLEASAQQQAFAPYPSGKVILATNIAQTSVTIDDIDVVIDSGLERRSEVRSGVEGLFIAQISQADCLQRAGRAGRTKAGQYILAPMESMACPEFADRPAYATPEILRKHIDRLTLRLANVGIDIEQLDFYHDPSQKAVQRAKRTLVALGAMTKSGDVTRIGRQMEAYPVESSYARMLVQSLTCPPSIQSKLAAIIGIQEIGGIVKSGPRFSGWRRYTQQFRSDLLAQYDVFIALPIINPADYDELGIMPKNVLKAREVMARLNRDLADIDLDDSGLTPISPEEEVELLKCIVAGQIDQLWTVDAERTATHISTNASRELSTGTVVRDPKLVAGIPFDLQVPARDGSLQTLHLVQSVTAVNTDWLAELAPETFSSKRGRVFYDPRSGQLMARQQVRLGGKVLEGAATQLSDNTRPNQRAFRDAFASWVYLQLERERRTLGKFHAKRIPAVPLPAIQTRVQALAGDIISLGQLAYPQRQAMLALAKLQTHLGEAFMAQLGTSERTDKSAGRHHAHRGWIPGHKRKYDRGTKH